MDNLFAGRYALGQVLGTGGTAKVYAAQDRRLDRPVAVKLVPTANAEPVARQRFVREARSAAAFTHPNAVALYDAGEADGYLFLVMELVEGQSLADRLATDGPLDAGEARRITSGVLAALAAAHAVGVVHRDIKPGNILLGTHGAVKLADFGIAKRLDDAAGDVTIIGDIVGTPKYLAPELIDGAPAAPSSDVYATGVVLFEMLAGRPPFDANTPLATALAHRNEPVPDVSALRPDIAPDLARVIQTAMAKDPARRFGSAGAMMAAVASRPQPGPATMRVSLPPTEVITPGYRSRGRPFWWVAAAAALLAGAAMLTLLVVNGDDPNATTVTSARSTAAPVTAATTALVTTAVPTTVPATTLPAGDPSTVDGIIAILQADPAAFGPRTGDVIDDLDRIRGNGRNAERRATEALEHAAQWVEAGELDPAVLAMLEPVLGPVAGGDEGEDEDEDD